MSTLQELKPRVKAWHIDVVADVRVCTYGEWPILFRIVGTAMEN